LGLWFLGESKIGSEVLNVAKLDLAGEKIVRAYGTLPHANIYGGVMFVAMGLIIQRLKKENLSISVVMLFFMGIALLVSFSRSAWLAFLMFLLVILAQQKVKFNWKKVLLFLVSMLFVMVVFNLHTLIVGRLLDFSWGAWEERSLFSRVALAIFNDNWYGVGAQNFVLLMDSYSADSLSPWFYQPVHNVFLLALGELGVFGLTALIAVLFALISIILGSMRRIVKLYRHYWNSYLAIMSGLLIIASFDHYLMTSFKGMFLFAMLSGLILRDAMDRKIAMEKLTE
jgi:O-antigen ligase